MIEECYMCGWNEERITDNRICLKLDFIDDESNNKSLENMRLLCPNCYLSLNGKFSNSKNFCKSTLGRCIIEKAYNTIIFRKEFKA